MHAAGCTTHVAFRTSHLLPPRFVLLLPYPSVVTSLRLLSLDPSLTITSLELGHACDHLQSCVFDLTSKMSSKQVTLDQQMSPTVSSPVATAIQFTSYKMAPQPQQQCSVYTSLCFDSPCLLLVPSPCCYHHRIHSLSPPPSAQVIAFTVVTRGKCVSISRIRLSGASGVPRRFAAAITPAAITSDVCIHQAWQRLRSSRRRTTTL